MIETHLNVFGMLPAVCLSMVTCALNTPFVWAPNFGPERL